MKRILILMIALISLTSLSFVSAQQYNCPGFGMMGGYGSSGVGVVFGWIFMIFFLIVLVLLIAWLMKQLQNNERRRK